MFTLIGNAGVGKMQPYTEPVLTPSGWKKMGEIKLNSKVICPVTGNSANVIAVHPKDNLRIYKISFSDGTHTECCNDHLWRVQTIKDITSNKKRVIDVNEMLEKGILHNPTKYRKPSYRYSVELNNAVNFKKQKTIIDPYLLGLLLGDGYLAGDQVALTSHSDEAEEVFDVVAKIIPKDVSIRLDRQYGDVKARHIRFSASIKKYILELGIKEKSRTKFIPKEYIYNTIDVRKKVLAGLLDTDGSVNLHKTKKKARFHTMSPRLKDDVVEIIRSLGGIATVNSETREKYNGGVMYAVNFRLPFNPFRRSKKKKAFDSVGYTFKFVKKITGIDFLREDKGQCITVDTKDHLYITRDYTVTHNSWLMRSVLEYFQKTNENTDEGNLMALFEGKGGDNVLGLAVSHKAKNVLSESIPNSFTIAAGLGMKVRYSPSGETIFYMPDNHYQTPPIFDADLIVVDGCSMISKYVFQMIIKHSPSHAKIVFTGDSAQLCPIEANRKPDEDSITFSVKNQFKLTEIMRQKEGNPILDIALDIRDQIANEDGRSLDFLSKIETSYNQETEEGGIVTNKNKAIKSFVANIKKSYDNDNEQGINSFYVAYRNKTVREANNLVRNAIFDTNKRFVPRDRVIALETFYKGKEVLVYNAKIYTIKSVKEGMRNGIHVWDLLFEEDEMNDNSTYGRALPIVHEDGMEDYKRELRALKKQAKKTFNWKPYYKFKEAFGSVDYAYAISSHRSQGSTFDRVYTDLSDIMSVTMTTTKEKLQGAYVACTRPTDILIVF